MYSIGFDSRSSHLSDLGGLDFCWEDNRGTKSEIALSTGDNDKPSIAVDSDILNLFASLSSISTSLMVEIRSLSEDDEFGGFDTDHVMESSTTRHGDSTNYYPSSIHDWGQLMESKTSSPSSSLDDPPNRLRRGAVVEKDE